MHGGEVKLEVHVNGAGSVHVSMNVFLNDISASLRF